MFSIMEDVYHQARFRSRVLMEARIGCPPGQIGLVVL